MMTQQFGQGFEGLEDRTLLAANVTATMINGTLVITGDATANDIQIQESVEVAGDIEVSIAGLGQTLQVNGGVVAEATVGRFSNVTNIVVNANAGDDSIDISGIDIDGDVSVNAGGGNNDSINLHSGAIATVIDGNVLLQGGGGTDDTIHVGTDVASTANLTVGSLFLKGSGGAGGISLAAEGSGDLTVTRGLVMAGLSLAGSTGTVELANHGIGELSVGGTALLMGGAGDDNVSVIADGGAGISIGSSLTVNGNGGNDNISVSAEGAATSNVNVTGSALLQGGGGDDDVSVSGLGGQVNLNNSLTLTGSIGDDNLTVQSTGLGDVNVTGRLRAEASDGGDFISMNFVNANGGLDVAAGSGDDTISVQDNTVTGNVWIFGQAGDDTFITTTNTISGGLGLVGGIDIDSHFTSDNTVGDFNIITQIENVLDEA